MAQAGHTPKKPWGTFNVGEIVFVSENMEVCTRGYVEAAYRAAKRRAKVSSLCAAAAARMKEALDTWPAGRFDSSCDAELIAIAKNGVRS